LVFVTLDLSSILDSLERVKLRIVFRFGSYRESKISKERNVGKLEEKHPIFSSKYCQLFD
jgi:hypothetical protein